MTWRLCLIRSWSAPQHKDFLKDCDPKRQIKMRCRQARRLYEKKYVCAGLVQNANTVYGQVWHLTRARYNFKDNKRDSDGYAPHEHLVCAVRSILYTGSCSIQVSVIWLYVMMQRFTLANSRGMASGKPSVDFLGKAIRNMSWTDVSINQCKQVVDLAVIIVSLAVKW